MRNFFLKLAAFSAILLTIQVVVSAMYPPELPTEILSLDQQLQAGVNVVYLGDSTLIHPLGEATIPEILRGLLPNHRLGDVAHPAYHLDLYERYVNYLVKHKGQVEAVIIPINMRSFSPEWDLRPTYQFEREKTILTYGLPLSSLFYQAFDTFGLFDSPISQADFQATTVFNGDQPVGEVAEFEELLKATAPEAEDDSTDFAYHTNLPSEDEVEALKKTLIYYYMPGLDYHHRKLQSLKATSRLLTDNGIKPIFYITPINYELGERHLGQRFHRQLAENTGVVERVLRRKGVDVLNLVFDLEAYNFVDTEHLTENGKTYIAKVLAAEIEPPQPQRPASTAVDDAPTPHLSAIEQSGGDDPTNTATPTPTAVKPNAPLPGASPKADSISPPTPTATLVVTATPRSLAARQAGQLVSAEFWTTFEPVGNYNVEVYRLRYKTVDRNERVTEVEANLYVPQVAEPTDFPVLVYGPGTTGLSDHCAPLNEWSSGNDWGAYHSYMLEYTAQGLIGVLPNYQGFDSPDLPHPYFISELQARALLDAARAAYNAFAASPEMAARPLEAVVMAGYSSGGHAVFAAKDFAASYAPELPFKGVIGHGPTTNPITLLKEVAVFSPYIVQAYRDFYGPEVIEPADIFQERWVARFQADVMSRCVDGLFSYYGFSARQMYRQEFSDALYADRLQAVAPAFQAALEDNTAGLSPDGQEIPVLILQGTADQIVTPPSQRQFAAALCRLGNRVTYLSYPAVDHPNIRRASFRDTINWIESVAAGDLPEPSCASLASQ
ncbi:MAG: alpha/beta fold hydrolase [Anaerolineae bacterium]|nr:alpha/beta fold hydrolase [Anaerolineae bacterium]